MSFEDGSQILFGNLIGNTLRKGVNSWKQILRLS